MSDESKYNKQSASLIRRIPTEEFCSGPQQPGDFCWDFDHERLGGNRDDAELTLYICLPGKTRWTPIHVKRGAPGGDRVWGWDGNEASPTIEPSIHWVGHWHGFLRNGVLVSC